MYKKSLWKVFGTQMNLFLELFIATAPVTAWGFLLALCLLAVRLGCPLQRCAQIHQQNLFHLPKASISPPVPPWLTWAPCSWSLFWGGGGVLSRMGTTPGQAPWAGGTSVARSISEMCHFFTLIFCQLCWNRNYVHPSKSSWLLLCWTYFVELRSDQEIPMSQLSPASLWGHTNDLPTMFICIMAPLEGKTPSHQLPAAGVGVHPQQSPQQLWWVSGCFWVLLVLTHMEATRVGCDRPQETWRLPSRF